MSRLTRDGTAEPVSRDQILRREQRGQGNIHFPCSFFPVQLTTSRIGNLTRLIHTLAIFVTILQVYTYYMYSYINRHAGTAQIKTETKDTMSLDYGSTFVTLGLGYCRMGVDEGK